MSENPYREYGQGQGGEYGQGGGYGQQGFGQGGGFGQQPGYGYGGPQGVQPDNNLVWGILTTVLCCLPLGIVSIVKATQVSGLWQQGRQPEAQKAADDAKKFAIWAAVAGVVVTVLYVLFVVVFGLSIGASSYSTN